MKDIMGRFELLLWDSERVIHLQYRSLRASLRYSHLGNPVTGTIFKPSYIGAYEFHDPYMHFVNLSFLLYQGEGAAR